MPLLHAIILGITQGLTEFLPISSSGHLIIVPWLFGWHDFNGSKDLAKAFDVALHLGTLVAVVAYFWTDLKIYVHDGYQAAVHRDRRATPAGRLAWLLLLSAVPAAIAGALGESFIEEKLGTIPLIAVSSIGFGLLLYWADNLPAKRSIDDYSVQDSLIVGAGAGAGAQPGDVAVGHHDHRRPVAEVQPRHGGPAVVPDGRADHRWARWCSRWRSSRRTACRDGMWTPMIIGVITAGIAGWLAIWGTLKLVRTHSFLPFVIYRVGLGVLLLMVYVDGPALRASTTAPSASA